MIGTESLSKKLRSRQEKKLGFYCNSGAPSHLRHSFLALSKLDVYQAILDYLGGEESSRPLKNHHVILVLPALLPRSDLRLIVGKGHQRKSKSLIHTKNKLIIELSYSV